MNPHLHPFKPRPIALFVAIALCELSTAHATPSITLAAQYALGSGASAATAHDALGEGSLNPAGTTFPSPSGADYYLNVSGASQYANNVFFHSYGFTGNPTNFGARASGNDVFYAQTSSLYGTTYTNSGASAVDVQFSFTVDAGQIALSGLGTGFADLLLSITRDQTVVSQGRTTITQTEAGYACAETDVGVLGNWASCSSATASSVGAASNTYTVDLGIVGVGQTIDIDYDILATVQGNYFAGSTSSGSCSGYGYPALVQTAVVVAQSQCVYYNAVARSGDPFNDGTSGSPANFSLNATEAAVPEPGTVALFGIAAGGAWALGRRRKGRPA